MGGSIEPVAANLSQEGVAPDAEDASAGRSIPVVAVEQPADIARLEFAELGFVGEGGGAGLFVFAEGLDAARCAGPRQGEGRG